MCPVKSPVELEGRFPRLARQKAVILGTEDALCFVIFEESLAVETGALCLLPSSIHSPCEFLCCASWIPSTRLSFLPPHQLPVPPCFIFNKR